MEGKRKMDFKKYTSPAVSKWYLARIAFYIILITGLLIMFFSQKGKPQKDVRETKKIENLKITIED